MTDRKEYIERGALIQKIADKFRNHYSDSCYQFVHDFFRCVMKQINNAPTINPDDIRPQGRWHYTTMGGIVSLNGYCCSLCHEQFFCKPYNYCPNCGAKMKGE